MVDCRQLIGLPVSDCDHHEQYRLEGERWADLEATAKILDDTLKDLLDQLVLKEINDAAEAKQKMAVNMAERLARQSIKYQKYRADANDAREKANKQRVLMKYHEMMIRRWENENANRRAEIHRLGFAP